MYNINITGDLMTGDDHHDVIIDDLDHLSIQLSINEDDDRPERCAHCGEEDPEAGEACPGSGNWVTCPADHEQGPGDEPCDMCDNDGEIEIHNLEPVPLHWVNSASIHARPDRDEIQVTISVADPRGAFVMSVSRMDDGTLRLSVPHPSDSTPHMPLSELNARFYKVGH